MNRFAALLDRLAFEPGRIGKLALIADHFRAVPDPARGFALAALTGGLEFRMVRVQLNRDALDKYRKHLFSLPQFRLVGKTREGDVEQYHAIAIQQADETDVTNRHIRFTKRGGKLWPATCGVYEPRDGNNGQVEVVFEVPTGFKPDFIEWEQH